MKRWAAGAGHRFSSVQSLSLELKNPVQGQRGTFDVRHVARSSSYFLSSSSNFQIWIDLGFDSRVNIIRKFVFVYDFDRLVDGGPMCSGWP